MFYTAKHCETVYLPADHPRDAVYVVREDIPNTERDGCYNLGGQIQRFRVASNSRDNYVGHPTSYEIRPSGNAAYILPQLEWYSKRGNFM